MGGTNGWTPVHSLMIACIHRLKLMACYAKVKHVHDKDKRDKSWIIQVEYFQLGSRISTIDRKVRQMHDQTKFLSISSLFYTLLHELHILEWVRNQGLRVRFFYVLAEVFLHKNNFKGNRDQFHLVGYTCLPITAPSNKP